MGPAVVAALECEDMAAAEQFFFPLADEIIGDDEGDVERSRALCGERAHHHNRLDGLAETDLVGEEPAAGGCGHHPMNTVELVRIGESADAEGTEQRLVAVDATRLRLKAEEHAMEVAHVLASAMVVARRSAA